MTAPLKKIVILGPESTGKSTLCEQLALHFNTLSCPEYARQFLSENGLKYNYDSLLTIAKGQLTLEDQFTEQAIQNKKNLLFNISSSFKAGPIKTLK